MKFKCINNISINYGLFGIAKPKKIPNITVGKIYYGGLTESPTDYSICFYNDNKEWDFLSDFDRNCFEPVEE